jgi:hypothetical protein
MAMIEIILTVQRCGNGNDRFRLGISTHDSREIFMTRGFALTLFLNPNGNGFETQTKCGPPEDDFDCQNCKKAYDLYDRRIHNWIIENNFHDYPPRNPTIFSFLYLPDEVTLTFQNVIIEN